MGDGKITEMYIWEWSLNCTYYHIKKHNSKNIIFTLLLYKITLFSNKKLKVCLQIIINTFKIEIVTMIFREKNQTT